MSDSRKKILFLCDASDVDVVENSFQDQSDYYLTIETTEKILSFGVKKYLNQTVERIQQKPELYDGIVGTHDSSSLFAAILAEETGKRFASVKGVINSQNKYICRRIQRDITPEAAPKFCLALDYLRDPSRLETPFFIKPVRSNISFGTHIIESPEALEYYIGHESLDISLFNQYYLNALAYSPRYYDAVNIATCNSFLCEDLISGVQVTIDGYVYEKTVFFLGVTRAIFHPRSNSFSHHEFPHHLPPALTDQIKDVLERLMPGLGLDNSFFNVELRVDEETGTFKIIEVNSRIAFQFAKTIEAVTGFDPLRMICDMAVGKKPEAMPLESVRQFPYCYNFELHAFADAKILETPIMTAYEQIRMAYPEVSVRNLVYENANLSDFKHNPQSYRYCLLDIPGENREDILAKYDHVVSMLGYKFGPVTSQADHDAVEKLPGRPPAQTKGGGRI